jgi:DNA polymerase-3 subunit delta
MEFDQILGNLKKKIYHPVYFLCGEEPYFIDIISDYIEDKVLTPEEKGFNQSVYYGKDTELRTVVEVCRRYPMMASQQVIIVKEAQSWKDLEPLTRYLKAPTPSTILVINYKYAKPDGRTEAGKILKEKAVYLETKSIREYNLASWIENFVKVKGYSVTPQSSQMLADFLGNDLSKIVNELNKLFIVLPAGSKITPEDIERNIGISKEYNPFELTEALGEKDVLKANRIISHFGANPGDNPMQPIIGALFSYFLKLLKYHALPDKSYEAACAAFGIGNFPLIVRKYIDAARRYNKNKLIGIIGFIREYDMKSKGLESTSAVSQGDLLKELVYKILH